MLFLEEKWKKRLLRVFFIYICIHIVYQMLSHSNYNLIHQISFVASLQIQLLWPLVHQYNDTWLYSLRPNSVNCFKNSLSIFCIIFTKGSAWNFLLRSFFSKIAHLHGMVFMVSKCERLWESAYKKKLRGCL